LLLSSVAAHGTKRALLGRPWLRRPWQLPSGLYLQSLGPCGTLELNRQAGSGALTRVRVPGMTESPVVVTATATRLLMKQDGCEGNGGQLAWFNPAAGTEQWIFRAGAGPDAVAYNDPENSANG
jgi:hypothetical protein